MVAAKQNTVAWIDPSRPNCPAVNHSAPSIFVVNKDLPMLLPEVLTP